MRQDVTASGDIADRIIWESKRTKKWTASWLAELRDLWIAALKMQMVTAVYGEQGRLRIDVRNIVLSARPIFSL